MTKWFRTLKLKDFPRGQRILRIGHPVDYIHRALYIDPAGRVVEMDPTAYLFSGDRLILAQDVWPKTTGDRECTVFVHYESRKD